jgi:hypothetical protein
MKRKGYCFARGLILRISLASFGVAADFPIRMSLVIAICMPIHFFDLR